MSTETLVVALGLLAFLSIGAIFALKPRLSPPRTASYEPHQPVPIANLDDLNRIIRRDFPSDPFEDVMTILEGYISRWKGPAVRVQLAALKLADGDLEAL